MEIILYDVVMPKLFFVSKLILLKSYPYCFYSLPEIETIRPFVHHMYTLHSDEVVSLLISGCEIVVCSCLPMAVTFYALLLNR